MIAYALKHWDCFISEENEEEPIQKPSLLIQRSNDIIDKGWDEAWKNEEFLELRKEIDGR